LPVDSRPEPMAQNLGVGLGRTFQEQACGGMLHAWGDRALSHFAARHAAERPTTVFLLDFSTSKFSKAEETTTRGTPTRRRKSSIATMPSAAEKVPPTMTFQLARTPKKAKPSAQRPGRAQRRRGVWECRGPSLTSTQHRTPTRRRKPSAAAIPSAAEKCPPS
jgi:hypothetical protein